MQRSVETLNRRNPLYSSDMPTLWDPRTAHRGGRYATACEHRQQALLQRGRPDGVPV